MLLLMLYYLIGFEFDNAISINIDVIGDVINSHY